MCYSAADATPRSERLTPFSNLSLTPPSPVRGSRPRPDDATSPATPCLRLALCGSAAGAGLSAGARRAADTPDMTGLRFGGGTGGAGLVQAVTPALGLRPVSMAPVKVGCFELQVALAASALQKPESQLRSRLVMQHSVKIRFMSDSALLPGVAVVFLIISC